MTDAGLILIVTVSNLDDDEAERIISLSKPSKTTVISVGENLLHRTKVALHIDQIEAVKPVIDDILKEINL